MIKTTPILSSTDECRVTCSIRLFAFTNSATKNCIYTSDPTLWSNSPMIYGKASAKDRRDFLISFTKRIQFQFQNDSLFYQSTCAYMYLCMLLNPAGNCFSGVMMKLWWIGKLAQHRFIDMLSVQRWEYVTKMLFFGSNRIL